MIMFRTASHTYALQDEPNRNAAQFVDYLAMNLRLAAPIFVHGKLSPEKGTQQQIRWVALQHVIEFWDA